MPIPLQPCGAVGMGIEKGDDGCGTIKSGRCRSPQRERDHRDRATGAVGDPFPNALRGLWHSGRMLVRTYPRGASVDPAHCTCGTIAVDTLGPHDQGRVVNYSPDARWRIIA